MRNHLSIALAVAFCWAGFHDLAIAQSYLYNVGNQQWGTTLPIENGFISVNNGEIHLEFPLATHAQRGGLSLDERLVYDSRIWQIVNSGSSYGFQPTNVPNSQGGWRFVSGAETGTVNTWPATQVFDCYQDGYAFAYAADTDYNFAWNDPSGAWHYFSNETQRPQYNEGSNPETQPCQGQTLAPPPDVSTSSGQAIDGSGYTMKVTNYTTVTIYDSHGTQVYPSQVDRYGNHYSTDSNGNLIDSLGRTPILKSTSGNQTFYDVLTYGGGRARYTVTTSTINVDTTFAQSGVNDWSGTLTVISSIGLPDGTSYGFGYDSGLKVISAGHYGELTSVTLPTGGVVQYGWANYMDSFKNVNRWLYTKTKDGGTTTYAPGVISSCSSSVGCQEKVVVTSPAGNDTTYTMTLDKGAITQGQSWVTNITAYSGAASSNVPLQSSNKSYVYTTETAVTGNGTAESANYPSTITETHTLNDVGLTAKTVTQLNSPWPDPSSVATWDYYSGTAPTTPTQTTTYKYVYLPLMEVPQQVTTTDGQGNLVAETTYAYDETQGTGHAPVVQVSNLPQQPVATGLDPAFVTTVTQWVNSGGTTLSTEASYDNAGMLRSTSDSNGITTYSVDSTGAYVSQTTLPTPSSGIALTSTASTDANTGIPSTATDLNGTTQKYVSYDSLNRLSETDRLDAENNLIGKQTISYVGYANGAAAVQSISTYTNASTSQTTDTQYDLYGRVSRVAVATGQSSTPWYQTDTCYDTTGNVSFRSYSYGGQGWSTTKVCSGAGDSYKYDALGRVILITHADSKTVQYVYTGRAVKVIDENNVTRISQIDGLGRVTGVCEVSSNNSLPNSGSTGACGLDVAATGFLTGYSYGLAAHSTSVTQGAQTRSFKTDFLGRPTQTQEPESGATSYSYSYNSTGLVVTRTRPAANQTSTATTATTTQYDALGRVLTIQYADGTPTKTFGYDAPSWWPEAASQTNMKGRLSSAWRTSSSGSAGTIYGYDASGNVLVNYECTPSGCGNVANHRTVSYGYDWTGALSSESDGAGVTYTYTRSLAGEMNGITSSLSSAGNPQSIVSFVQNTAFGPISYSLGNGLTQALQYDTLGRLAQGSVCAGGGSGVTCSGGTTLYGFSTYWSGRRVYESMDSVMVQTNTYGYDEFDRLNVSNINSGRETDTYVYDRWGNRWQRNITGSGSGYQTQYSYNSSNHLLQASYDAAGNMIMDPQGTHYLYDADGNVTQVGTGSGATIYVYDALNRRVRVQLPGSGGTWESVFDQNGSRVSVWNATTNTFNNSIIYADGAPIGMRSGGATHFQHGDWLGTPRLISTATGTIETTFTSAVFGDSEKAAGPDYDRNHYAGLDWDGESGTFHADYRQYQPIAGNWMSPDPYPGSYNLGNPQSLNRYAYSLNSPVSLSDPSGLQAGDDGPSSGGCAGACDVVTLGLVALASAIEAIFGDPAFQGSLQPRPDQGFQRYCISNCGLHAPSDPLSSSGFGGPHFIPAYYVHGDPVRAPSNPTRLFLPPNALNCTGMGKQFYAPPQFNLNQIVAAGQTGGRFNLSAMNGAVGHFGTYDYQRVGTPSSFTFYSGYTPVSNIDVGAYLYGAGFSQSQAGTISNTFANLFSKNAGNPNQAIYRNLGYQMAAGKGSYSCSAIPQ